MAEERAGIEEREVKHRRRFTEEFKRQVVAETLSGENSVAGIALRHRLNNNLVFTWRRKHLRSLSVASAPAAKMLPVTIAAADPASALPVAPTAAGTKRSDRARSSGTIEIACNGKRVVVRGAVDAQALQIVLAALSHG
jgi:transposase